MKKLITLIAIFGALFCSSFATPMTVQMSTFGISTSGNYTAKPNAGLVYVLSNYAPGAANSVAFGTFCLEYNEYFVPGTTYNAVINDRAVRGGAGSPTFGYDILSIGSAWLYNNFALGTLDNYGYVYGNASAASSLQNAFWVLENELPISYMAVHWQTVLVGQFGSVMNAQADYTGNQYGVKVLNLTDAQGNRHQDQLVFVGVPVSEGAHTLMLVGGALGALGMMVRRKD